MRRRGPGLLWLALGLLLPFGSWGQAPDQQVVYHLDSGQRSQQVSALQMMQNHIDAVKPGRVDMVVVVQGKGVSLFLEPGSLERISGFDQANADQEMIAMIDHLRNQGVRFLVSGSTLARHRIDAERDLYQIEPSEIVDNGVEELVRRQQQGYVYLKP